MDHHQHEHHMDHIGHSSQTSQPMMMHHAMSFHFGTTETILFNFWKTETGVGMLASCLVTVFITFLMETIRFLRNYRKTQMEIGSLPVAPEERLRIHPKLDAIDPIMHALQLTLAYMLMLIFMTFNVYLCVATVLGEILAHLVYRTLFPFLSDASSSHC